MGLGVDVEVVTPSGLIVRMGVVMADVDWQVSDQLWERALAVLPEPKPRRFDHPGRRPADDRRCLEGILYVLRYGVPWDAIPRHDGRPAGITCYKRMRRWTDLGVWDELYRLIMDELARRGGIDLCRALVDSSDTPAKKGARKRVVAPKTVDAASSGT
jgi:transposase